MTDRRKHRRRPLPQSRKPSELEVFKVQKPRFSNETGNLYLFYNRARTSIFQLPSANVPVELQEWCAATGRAFVLGKIVDNQLVVSRRVADRDW